MTTKPLVKAAAYIRMSTSKQEDSPERQRREILILAERDGYEIVEWYEDLGKSGTESAKRKDFQRLLTDAKTGRFRAVLVHEHSRFSRENFFEVMAHFKILNDFGVNLVTSRRGVIRFDDLAGVMMAIVDSHSSHDESKKIADRTLSGKLAKASRGIRMGRAPFGYDREIIDDLGQVVKRVTFREKFVIPKGWKSRLVPSTEIEAIEAIQFAFDAVLQSNSLGEIVAEFRRRGVTRSCGKPFTFWNLLNVLQNPVYAGVFRFGHKPVGKFSRCDTDMVIVENHHPAIVSIEKFRSVQTVLNDRRKMRARSHAPGRYLLAGLVVCEHCGRRIYGSALLKGRKFEYRCMSRDDGINCVGRPSLARDDLEGFVIDLMQQWVFAPENLHRIIEAAHSLAGDQDGGFEDQQIEELNFKINRATENLAVASREDYDGIATVIRKWRKQITEIQRQMKSRRRSVEASVEVQAVLRDVESLKRRLLEADRSALSVAIHSVVERITLGRRRRQIGSLTVLEPYGLIEFKAPVIEAAPVSFAGGDFFTPRRSHNVAEVVAAAGRPVTLKELTEALGRSRRTVHYHVNRALKMKIVRRVGNGLYLPVAN